MQPAQSSSDFALRLTQQCYENGKNLCLSPYSARIALSMALNGARGETLRQMAKVLGYGSSSIEQINQSNIKTHRMVSTGLSYKELMVANALWMNDHYRLNPDYVQRVSSKYGAVVKPLDFSNPRSVDVVNQWISEATNGWIQKMNDRIDPMMMCIIVNTVFYQGKWLTPFEPKDNTRATWYGSANRRSQIVYMNQNEDMDYKHTNDFDAVRLPYQQTGISMYLMLPRVGSTPQKVLSKLTSKSLTTTVKSLSSKDVYLTLPKFKLESDIKLIPPLEEIGMKVPFSEHADFSILVGGKNDGSFIGQIKQKCSVEVDEKGTVAAAATEAIPVGCFSMPVKLTFNRPFVFLIRHDPTGELLFTGVVNQPQA